MGAEERRKEEKKRSMRWRSRRRGRERGEERRKRWRTGEERSCCFWSSGGSRRGCDPRQGRSFLFTVHTCQRPPSTFKKNQWDLELEFSFSLFSFSSQ